MAFRSALRGDPEGQRVLYDTYAAQVFGVCRRYARNREEAEDFAQDAWLCAFAKLTDCRRADGFPGWLRRVTVTTCLQALRRGRPAFDEAAAALLNRGELPLPAAFQVAPEALAAMSAGDLVALVSDLPEGYRAVFNLVAVEGYSHAEAAEALGISLGTSRSQLTRARHQLQKRLGQFAAVCL